MIMDICRSKAGKGACSGGHTVNILKHAPRYIKILKHAPRIPDVFEYFAHGQHPETRSSRHQTYLGSSTKTNANFGTKAFGTSKEEALYLGSERFIREAGICEPQESITECNRTHRHTSYWALTESARGHARCRGPNAAPQPTQPIIERERERERKRERSYLTRGAALEGTVE